MMQGRSHTLAEESEAGRVSPSVTLVDTQNRRESDGYGDENRNEPLESMEATTFTGSYPVFLMIALGVGSGTSVG
jgi:hypothetical protein